MPTFLWTSRSLLESLKGKLATPAFVLPMLVYFRQRLINIDTQRTPAGRSRTQKVLYERTFRAGKAPDL